MKHRGTLIAGAVVTALALPATAGAHADVSQASVAKHVRSADEALAMVESLVSHNKDARAAVQFARNQAQTDRAAGEAARLVRTADRRPERVGAANATGLVAVLFDRNVETYAELVDEVSGSLQEDMGDAIVSDLSGRERALDRLTELAPTLPQQAQAGIARAIAALSTDGEDEILDMVEALESGDLSNVAEQSVSDALELAYAGIDQGIARLGEVVGLVPEQARPHVQAAVDRAVAQLEGVKERLGDLLSGLPIDLPIELPFG